MTKLIVITGFVIAFAAGIMTGLVLHRPGGPNAQDRGGRQSFMANQLGLNADQQAKMKAIWENVGHRGPGNDSRAKRGAIRREQEEAIAGLIHTSDEPAYDKIIADTKAKLDAIDAESRQQFQQAVEKTKAMLTPEQLKKYDVLLARPSSDRDRDRPGTRPNG